MPELQTHLEVGCEVAGAEVCLPVVEGQVCVAWHEAPGPVEVGTHVGVCLQSVCIVYVPTDL